MATEPPLTGWGKQLLLRFVGQIEAYRAAFVGRIFPAFEGIESEAEEYMHALYREAGQMPYDGSVDMADLAEYATHEGVEYYESLRGVRQSIYSIALAGLYHLLEQQMMFFLRRELLDPGEEDRASLLTRGQFQRRLELRGIALSALPSSEKIEELRLIANVIKHGEGKSATDLRSARPDLFDDPQFSDHDSFPAYTTSIYTPLAGEDLYPTPGDVGAYTDAAIAFWNELLVEYFASSL